MAFQQAPLPYAADALEPYLSARTFEFHYGKHHAAYITNLNNLIKDSELATLSLEDVIKSAAKDPAKVGIFNNAAQTWNHTFFWESLKPGGGGVPTGDLADKITAAFGSYEAFKDAFKTAATTQFGSGWAWLVVQDGTLKITKTSNADTPLTVEGQTPLLTLDVWEHAYYLKYQNRRPDYLDGIWNVINWAKVAELYAAR